MVYRNKNTGAIVDFGSEISGGPWEPVEVPRPAKANEPKTTAKSSQKSRTTKK